MEGAYPRVYPALASPDCVLDLAFDEGSGQQVVDASQHANHGAMQNMEEGDWVIGHDGKGFALHFDGINERVQIAGATGGLAGQRKSTRIGFWTVDNPLDVNLRAVVCIDTASTGPQGNGIDKYHWYGGGLDRWSVDLGAIFADTWYRMAASHDNVTLRWYHNAEAAGAPAGSLAVDYIGNIGIGGRSNGTGFWHEGKLAGVQIYKEAVAREVLERLYEQRRARYDAPVMVGHMGLAA